jgi:adenylate cyclase
MLRWVIDGGSHVTTSSDSVSKASNDMRSVGEALVRMSRMLHEHARKLEVAVDGTYASEGSDPRVRLLSESLRISRVADLELGRINQSMQRILQSLQQPIQGNGQAASVAPAASAAMPDHEREALTTSISHLKQQRNELGILYEIARTLNSTLEFDEVLRLVMDRVIEFVNAERGFLMLVNPATNEPEFTIARDKDAHTIPESAFATARISRGTVKRVIGTRQPLLAEDAMTDNALSAQESIVRPPDRARQLHRGRVRR